VLGGAADPINVAAGPTESDACAAFDSCKSFFIAARSRRISANDSCICFNMPAISFSDDEADPD
jgi:hypothetical protein